MIILDYKAFRRYFALPGAPIVIDGLPEWPASMVNANGFDGGISISPDDASVYHAIVDGGGPDGGPELFDWYLSLRTAKAEGKPILASPVDGASGKLVLGFPEYITNEFPNPFVRSVVPRVFGSCLFFVRRRSDGAIQALDVERYVSANLATDD